MYFIFFVLAMVGVLSPDIAWGDVNCSQHKLYCAIVDLRPDMKKEWAMELSNAVYKGSKKYGLDPYRSLAIGMQESSLKRINRKQKMIIPKEVCEGESCEVSYEIVEGYTDISLWQFHINTIQNYKMDIQRLAIDIEYATEFHFRLLKEKVEMCSKFGEDAWTCYHSATEKHRLLYKSMVDKYYKRITNE